MDPARPKKIWWWQPLSYSRPRDFKGMREIWTSKSVLKIILVCVVIWAAIACLAEAFVPYLEFDWIRYFVLAVLAMASMIAAYSALMFIFPASVSVTEKGIAYQFGESVSYYPLDKLQSVTLKAEGEHIVLRLVTEKGVTREYGVSPRVDLDDLAKLLGDRLSLETPQPPRRQGVIMLIRRPDGLWLAVRRAARVERAPLKIGFPGGEIEPGESHELALIREAREELAITIRPLRPIWQHDLPDRPWRLHAWLCEWTAGELRPDPAEIAEILWLPLDEAAAHPDALPSMPPLCAAIAEHESSASPPDTL